LIISGCVIVLLSSWWYS